MQAIRHLLAQRHAAVLLCAATMLLKLLVPTGYMIAATPGGIALQLCSGLTAPPSDSVTKPMPGMTHRDGAGHGMTHHGGAGHGKSSDHDKADMPCAFAGLSAVALGTVDPILLATLIAYVLAIWLVPVAGPVLWREPSLRPPLRGPPVTA